MNDITFKKQNGGMGRTADNDDPVSGLLIGLNDALTVRDEDDEDVVLDNGSDLFSNFESVGGLFIARLRFVEQLKDELLIARTEGDSLTAAQKAMNYIQLQVEEFFRQSESGTLYLAVKLSGEISDADLKTLQMYSGGRIRQAGIAAAGDEAITAQQFADWQKAAVELEKDHMPLSVVVALRKGDYGSIADLRGLSALATSGRCNVSAFVGKNLATAGGHSAAKLDELADIGILLGAVSAASVNESVAWVQKFPLKVEVPGFITGEELKATSNAALTILNENRLIFFRSHVGASDVYFNDSHTLDVPTSDYAYIENVRTMDKATRGIRANLLPYLNAPLKVDAETGKLDANTMASLETVAGRALEDMEKAGELSGYKVEIDTEQNVLATSTLEIVIRNVPMGVMRKVTVKIGFATNN